MLRVALALLFGLALRLEAQPPPPAPSAAATNSGSLTEAAAQVAARMSSLLPRRAIVSLEIQNLAPLQAAEWLSFRNSLQDELRKAGLETAGTPPESRVRVTLSETSRGLLLVAEVLTGDNRQIVVLPWRLPPAAQTTPRIVITKKTLWAQPEQILDVLMTPNPDSQMLVLSANQIVSYRLMGEKWMPVATASLALPRPIPRDPRGRLEPTADGFRAYLPIATCSGTLQPQLRVTCSNATEPWADTHVHWVADRNTLESDGAQAPFFTSAGILFAMANGHTQDRSGQPVTGSEDWGSDIAAIESPCGAGTPAVIASSASADQDEVRAYEVINGQANPASDALPLAGPVAALWPAEAHSEATLVVRNQQTGEYEASRLGLVCAR